MLLIRMTYLVLLGGVSVVGEGEGVLVATRNCSNWLTIHCPVPHCGLGASCDDLGRERGSQGRVEGE